MFKPKYTISDKVLNQLSGIAEIKALISRSALLPEREIFLRRDAVIKMAHTSTSIEGNQLQEYQVAQVADGKQVNAEGKQIKEVKNYLAALREIDKLAKSKKNFNSDDILKIHRAVIDNLVEPKKVGVFRS
jgi:Fic family protein